MAQISLSKSSLTKQTRQLGAYQRYLPVLDLKRKQLIAERAKAAAVVVEKRLAIEALELRVSENLPMLADHEADVTGLVRVKAVHLVEENLLGTRLPVIEGIDLEHSSYPLLGKPHWVDKVAEDLATRLKQQIELHVAIQRLERLQEAARKITQRVNLFEKILIPQTKATIKRIRIYLGDAERSAVARAKIVKSKQQNRPAL